LQINELAFNIVQQATRQIEKPKQLDKHSAAVTLARLGGLKGERREPEKLSAKKPSEIAVKRPKLGWRRLGSPSKD
jgi:hypothetical protein